MFDRIIEVTLVAMVAILFVGVAVMLFVIPFLDPTTPWYGWVLCYFLGILYVLGITYAFRNYR